MGKDIPEKSCSGYINVRQILRVKTITRNKDSHFIMIGESFHHKNIIILNVYAPNNRASKYMKQKLIELHKKIDKSTIIQYFSLKNMQ